MSSSNFVWLSLLFYLFLCISPIDPASSTQNLLNFRQANKKTNLKYKGKIGDYGQVQAPRFLDNETVHIIDYNNDHWPDILLTGDTKPSFFANQNGSFLKDESFPSLNFKINNFLVADFNQDGWTDLIAIPQSGKLRLIINKAGHFGRVKKLQKPNLIQGRGGAVGDFNQDGCPDILIYQYNSQRKNEFFVKKRKRLGKEIINKELGNGHRNYLLSGQCNTSFELVEEESLERDHWSLAASVIDLNNDGLQDIHITNDYHWDSLYINQGGFKFKHTYLGDYSNRNGMASEVLNLNHDAYPDLFISNIFTNFDNPIWDEDFFLSEKILQAYGHNALVNISGENFKDRAEKYNLKEGGWGWSATSADFDNDFKNELIQAKSNVLVSNYPIKRFNLSNFKIAKFLGEYIGFKPIDNSKILNDTTTKNFWDWVGYPGYWDRSKTSFERKKKVEKQFGRLNARGVVHLDYDMDGDLDVFFTQHEREFKLYENISKNINDSWVKFQIPEDYKGGLLRIKYRNKTKRIFLNEKNGFFRTGSPIYHVGLNEVKKINEVSIKINGEPERVFKDLEAKKFYLISGQSIKRINLQEKDLLEDARNKE